MSFIETKYTCDRCLATRNIHLEEDDFENKTYSPKDSSNGLFIYSDIHRCEGGILGINNLHIDHNSDVRSFEYLKLPKEKNNRKILSGLPSPKTTSDPLTKYRITSINSTAEFRLMIIDKDLGVYLLLGDVNETTEQPLAQIESKRSAILLKYYKSEIYPSENVISWLQEMINLLELLPPTKIGLFIDTLRYISTLTNIPPVKFHLKMLKTVLVSHEVRFILNEPNGDIVEELSKKDDLYDPDIIMRMLVLVEKLSKVPNSSLQEFTKLSNWEISDLIYLFLLLEQDGVITIQYPPTIDY